MSRKRSGTEHRKTECRKTERGKTESDEAAYGEARHREAEHGRTKLGKKLGKKLGGTRRSEPKHAPRASVEPVSYETVCKLARLLPEVEESTSYGTPALKVRGKMFVRLKEDGETIVLRTDAFEREHLLRMAPGTFFITDHYRDYPLVLVRLSAIGVEQLSELLEAAWHRVAPKRLVAAHDAER